MIIMICYPITPLTVLFSKKKNGWVDPKIYTFLIIKVWQKLLPIFCSRNSTTSNKYHASFGPYLSNTLELRYGSCAPKWCAKYGNYSHAHKSLQWQKLRFRYLGPSTMPLWFVLDVLLAGTGNTSSNTFLVVLCTIWHEKVNGSSFYAINYNFIFKVKFLVE